MNLANAFHILLNTFSNPLKSSIRRIDIQKRLTLISDREAKINLL